MSANWQRRWQPLLEQWVIIAANSAERPWSGSMATPIKSTQPEHDPGCYLCPGVTRATGSENPDYQGAYAFDNDFPTLAANAPDVNDASDPLFITNSAKGKCRVLCWSEKHNATLASINEQQMIDAANLWRNEYITLSADPTIAQVLIFENKGVEIGVSNLHPHGQIYATNFVTENATRMRSSFAQYTLKNKAPLLQTMLSSEPVQQQLMVEQCNHWSVIVPFAARFSYETWIIPHRAITSIAEASEEEIAELALCYQRQVRRYDALFERSAPNITLLHNAPCDNHEHNQHWGFHIAFHPPLRDASKMKFLAGFEAGSSNIVNPLMPETAAQRLRQLAQAG